MLKSTYTPAAPLPPGWTEHRAPTGHPYYYNASTKQSTYSRPCAPKASSPNEPSATASPLEPGLNPWNASSTPPSGLPNSFPPSNQYGLALSHEDRGQGHFRGGRGYQDRRQRQPEDRPKSKHSIPGCEPWMLVKTKLGRRFVHDPEKNESFWKFPELVLKGVVEYDRIEREKKERRERREDSELDYAEPPVEPTPQDTNGRISRSETVLDEANDDGSDEYEEVEVTDDEDDEGPSKKARNDDGEQDQAVEFNEDDIAYQLAAMGQDYGLDPGEYGEEEGEGQWAEGAEGLLLTEEDSDALFRDLLDDFQLNPYTPWETIIEEGRIIEDDRYTVLPNMRARKDVWRSWSTEKIQQLKEQRQRQEKTDPRIGYLPFLQGYATPKLYWPEFKRKYKKEPEMRDSHLTDKDREKFYRDHIARLKLPESTRKSDLSALLKSIPLHLLNQSSTLETLPSAVLTDLRFISLNSKVRDPLIEAYISTLLPAPEPTIFSSEEQEELEKKKAEREKREKALADRERSFQEEKRKQTGALRYSKEVLREGEAEIERAMNVGKDGLRGYLDSEARDPMVDPPAKA